MQGLGSKYPIIRYLSFGHRIASIVPVLGKALMSLNGPGAAVLERIISLK